MIIFGWGHRKEKDYGETYPIECSRCNNSTYWKLIRIQEWFELFFIPVFPYKSKHWLLCPICSTGLELDDEKLDHAKKLNQITLSFLDKGITEEEYNNKLNNYDKLFIEVKQTK